MDTFLSDLRYAARGLLRTKGVALVAVIALALGIGLTTVMFSIVYGAEYRGLPFAGADRIMSINRSRVEFSENRIGVTIHDYVDWSARQRSFEQLGADYSGTINVTSAEKPDRYFGSFVSGNALTILGVQPILGRLFTADDDRPGAPVTLLLGYRAWRDHFGADRAVIGRTVKVNGEPATVIGVMPEGFLFPDNREVWVPLRTDPVQTARGEGPTLAVFGRVKPGVSVDAASAELAGIAKALADEHPASNKGVTATVTPFTDEFLGKEERRTLVTMMITVSLVLLIACANVANLLLARAAVRTRDVAIRVSLGASRSRVVLQMLAEAMVLALLGAVLGTAFAWLGIGWFAGAVAPANLPFWFVFQLDGPILAFVCGISVVAALVSGAIPAFKSSTTDLNSVLKDESRGSSSLHLGRLSRGLVVAEVAMSVALLVASGLMIRSVVALGTIHLPYPTRDVFTARVALLDDRFPNAAARARFWTDLEQRVGALAGVRAAGLATALPGQGANRPLVQVAGESYTADKDIPRGRSVEVSPGFFAAFDAKLLQGRLFTALDGPDAPRVAVVNESFVRARFPDGVALGRRIRAGALNTKNEWSEIVGVIGDLGMVNVDREGQVERDPPGGFYVPIAQTDQQFVSVAARASVAPLTLTAPVRDAVAALDADTPIYFAATLQGRLDDNLWFYRVFGTLFAVFGGAALFMASVGLYGVMSFSVSRRSQEMGIRMALGAQAAQVRALVLRQAMTQIGVGLVLGTGLALLLGTGIKAMTYDQHSWDPATYALVFVVLALTGLVATAAPAARATRVDPIEALRSE